MTANGHDDDTVTHQRGDAQLPSLALAVILMYLCEGRPVVFSEEQLQSVAGTGVVISWNESSGHYTAALISGEEAMERIAEMPPNKEEMN